MYRARGWRGGIAGETLYFTRRALYLTLAGICGKNMWIQIQHFEFIYRCKDFSSEKKIQLCSI